MNDGLENLRKRHPYWGRREWSELAYMLSAENAELSEENKAAADSLESLIDENDKLKAK